jgi:PAS domain S-box-containing protein
MAPDSLTRLRSRLEAARADAPDASAQGELDLCLAELEVLWEELENQADHLARERGRYTAFFDCAPFACAMTEGSGVVREANRALCELLGVSATYLTGKPLAIFFADADRSGFRGVVARAAVDPLHGRRTWSGTLNQSDGLGTSVELTATNLPHAKGSAPALLLFVRPVD